MINSKLELRYVIPKLMSYPGHSAVSTSSSINGLAHNITVVTLAWHKIMNEKIYPENYKVY